MLAPHFKDEIAGLQKWLFLAGFDLFWCSFFIVTHIYGQTMYILQKNCPQTSFPGGKEAPNILHGGKMLDPHFEDEIVSLQKWTFLSCFDLFWRSFFFVTHMFGQTMNILQKDCPQMSFPDRILDPLLKGLHCLLN